MATQTQTRFRRMLRGVSKDWLVVPILTAELAARKFRGFKLYVDGWSDRPYDGKFHPSTHTLWTERQLAIYLLRPDVVQGEDFTLTSILAITQGKFWHKLVEKVLLRHGIMVRAELPIHLDECNIVGHMDGFLATNEGFEFKTMNDIKFKRIITLADFRRLCPEYFGQVQDYLIATGLSQMRVVIMILSNPYSMVEIIVPADDKYQDAQREKYTEAIALAAAGSIGDQCEGCTIFSSKAKNCPVAQGCPVGRGSM